MGKYSNWEYSLFIIVHTNKTYNYNPKSPIGKYSN